MARTHVRGYRLTQLAPEHAAGASRRRNPASGPRHLARTVQSASQRPTAGTNTSDTTSPAPPTSSATHCPLPAGHRSSAWSRTGPSCDCPIRRRYLRRPSWLPREIPTISLPARVKAARSPIASPGLHPGPDDIRGAKASGEISYHEPPNPSRNLLDRSPSHPSRLQLLHLTTSISAPSDIRSFCDRVGNRRSDLALFHFVPV